VPADGGTIRAHDGPAEMPAAADAGAIEDVA